MALVFRTSSIANAGPTTIKNSALTYEEGDGNFAYLLTNLSGSTINIIGNTLLTGQLQLDGNVFLSQLTSASQNYILTYNTSSGRMYYTSSDSFAAASDLDSYVTTSSFNSFTSSYNTGSFTGSFTGALEGTSSWALSASWAPFTATNTGSLLTTASVSLNTITFTKGDGSTFPITVDTGSGGSGTPAPSDTFIQYNSGSAFGADASFRFIYASQSLQHGFAVTASGLYSHAEGDNTQAIGMYSHAEGSGMAYGEISHAEGEAAVYGYSSHAEGASIVGKTNAFSASIVNGIVTMSAEYPDYSSDFNNFSTPPSIGPNLFIYDEEFDNNYGRITRLISSSVYVGSNTIIYLYDTSVNTQTAYILNTNNLNLSGNKIIPGLYSHAEGYGIAIAEVSHAEGEGIATGYSSHAEAYGKAIGEYSHAEGSSTSVGNYSHAEGSSTSVGIYSHAEGFGTTAIGPRSHAEGSTTTAYGTGSHTEGYGTVTRLDFSHAEGYETIARAYESHAEGYLSSAGKRGYLASISIFTKTITIQSQYGNVTASFLGTNRIVAEEGIRSLNILTSPTQYLTTASVSYDGTNTIITYNETAPFVGSNCVVTPYFDNSTIISDTDPGTYVAIGYDSHAEGIDTLTLGMASHAEGYKTRAVEAYTHAEGKNTIAIKEGSHAEGISTQTAGIYSHAEGAGTITSASYQNAQGIANVPSSVEGAFIVGNGTVDSTGAAITRSNLIHAAGNTVEITGSLIVTGSATITNVLTLPYQDPLPSSPATGSIALSGSGATFVGMFVWTGVWTQI